MSINQRRHIRLTIDIPVFRYTKTGEKIKLMIYQISIGGCFIEWEESIEKNDEFRIEIQLPNKNWLPLYCRALYRKEGDGIGVEFVDITKFEQELIVQIMLKNLADDGIPLNIDPFSQPKTFLLNETDNFEMKSFSIQE